MKQRTISIINVIVTIFSIVGIALISSGATPLLPASQISDETAAENLALPPGFTFSIWSVIYLGFIAYSIHQFVKGAQASERIQTTTPLVTLSIFLNLVWIIIVGLKGVVLPYILQWLMMYISIVILKHADLKGVFNSRLEKLIFISLALYAGWLSVAMIPFTSDILLLAGWHGEPLGLEFWAVIVYILAFIIIFGIYYKYIRFAWYTVPLTWAFVGLAVRFFPGVGTVAAVLAMLGVFIFVNEASKRRA